MCLPTPQALVCRPPFKADCSSQAWDASFVNARACFLLTLIDALLGVPGDCTEPRVSALKHSRKTKLLGDSGKINRPDQLHSK
jgi:hypothetical protein